MLRAAMIGLQIVAACSLGFAGVFNAPPFSGRPVDAPPPSSPTCIIKGSVKFGSGERIYRLPGQRHYAETIIRPEYGERWFCSEEEARASGWHGTG